MIRRGAENLLLGVGEGDLGLVIEALGDVASELTVGGAGVDQLDAARVGARQGLVLCAANALDGSEVTAAAKIADDVVHLALGSQRVAGAVLDAGEELGALLLVRQGGRAELGEALQAVRQRGLEEKVAARQVTVVQLLGLVKRNSNNSDKDGHR